MEMGNSDGTTNPGLCIKTLVLYIVSAGERIRDHKDGDIIKSGVQTTQLRGRRIIRHIVGRYFLLVFQPLIINYSQYIDGEELNTPDVFGQINLLMYLDAK